MESDRPWFEADVLERFLRYVRIFTTSDRHGKETPTTPGQWDLARLLERELRDLGVQDVHLDEKCYLIARIPASAADQAPTIGFMAHVDTTEDYSGKDVNPQVHAPYGGGRIELSGATLDPAEFPELADYVGETIITTDGKTLLGADDKAGVAEVMTAVRYLLAHPEVPRPNLEIIFTPDEETGHGMDNFPLDQIRSGYCYTVDGGDEGTIEAESFTAYKARVDFYGRVIHPGTARGKLVNAVTMAGHYLALLPRNESPEATDGRYGFYCPTLVAGGLDHAHVEMILRDFDADIVERRIAAVRSFGEAVQAAFPGGRVVVQVEKQYRNMHDSIATEPRGLDLLARAVRATGMEPIFHSIRGGTDGSRLTEMGVPTPNLFAGGHNMHGRFEWVALRSMVRAAKTLVNLAALWATGEE